MTGTANISPLAALLTGGMPSQAGTLPLGSVTTPITGLTQTGALSASGAVDGPTDFSSLLQLVKLDSLEVSRPKTTGLPAGLASSDQAAPLPAQRPPPGLVEGVKRLDKQNVMREMSLADSALQSELMPSGSEPDVDMPQGLSIFLSKKENYQNHEFIANSSSIELDSDLTATANAADDLPGIVPGIDAPRPGKVLPGITTTRPDRSNPVPLNPLAVSVEDTDSMAVAQNRTGALILKRQAPMPLLAASANEGATLPEFAAPVAKAFGTVLNGSVNQLANHGLLTQHSGTVDANALATASGIDAETTQAELTRSTTTSPLDRANPIQQAVTTLTLPRPAGAPGWDQGLGQRILWMVENGLNQAELRLDPPNLGSVNIRISLQDEQAQLQFQASHPGAREALESALPKLREMFDQQGLSLGDADVSDQQTQADTGDGSESSELQAQWDRDEDADSADPEATRSGELSVSDVIEGSRTIDEFV